MNKTYFKVSLRLDVVTPLESNDQGYSRVNTDTFSDFTITGLTEAEVLGQARQHVDVLLNTYSPVKDIDR